MANSPERVEFPEVIELNVGGRYFSTTLLTLTKGDTKLSAMFSGKIPLPQDKEGRYFIDADSSTFYWILHYLRSGKLPPVAKKAAVYKAAVFFDMKELALEIKCHTPKMFYKQVKAHLYSKVKGLQEAVEFILEMAISLASKKCWPKTYLWVAIYRNSPDMVLPFYTAEYPPHTCGKYIIRRQATACPPYLQDEQAARPCECEMTPTLDDDGSTPPCSCEAASREQQNLERTLLAAASQIQRPSPIAAVGQRDKLVAAYLTSRLQEESARFREFLRNKVLLSKHLVWQTANVTIGPVENVLGLSESRFLHFVTLALKDQGFCVQTRAAGRCEVRVWDYLHQGVAVLPCCNSSFFRMTFTW